MSNWADSQAVEQAHEFIDLSGFTASGTTYKSSENEFQTGYIYRVDYNFSWGGGTNNSFYFHLISSAGYVRDGFHYVYDGASQDTPYIRLVAIAADEGEVSGHLNLFNAADSNVRSNFFWRNFYLKDNASGTNTERLGNNSAHCRILESHTKFRITFFTTTLANGSYIKVTKRKILV